MANKTKLHFVSPEELHASMPEHLEAFKRAFAKIERRYGKRVLIAAMNGVNFRQLCAAMHDIHDVPDELLSRLCDCMIGILKMTDLNPEDVDGASKLLDEVVLAARATGYAQEMERRGAGKEATAAAIEKAKGGA